MDNAALLTFFIILRCFAVTKENEITCEDDDVNDEPSCFVTETAINASDFTISGPEDDTVRLFISSYNRNVEFLPIRIGEKFPNLVKYAAERCRIGDISKSNFENLFHLRTLNLNGNRIEIIKSDSFNDLVSLQSLFLARNRIKAMESASFRHFRSLNHVNLLGNPCVTANTSDVKMLSSVIDESCEKTFSMEIKPTCEVIGKCPLGEKCCHLSKFTSVSRFELKKLEYTAAVKSGKAPSSGGWVKLEIDETELFDAISYNNNPNVEYLLIDFGWQFTKLKVYDASNCAVRQIFWKNFEQQSRLESINLANNQISALGHLEELYNRMPLKNLDLSNNRIKFLAANQFTMFSESLEIVNLTSNVCIDEKFVGKVEIQKMISSLDSKCMDERSKSNESVLFCEEFSRCVFGICGTIQKESRNRSADYQIVSTDFARIQGLVIRDFKHLKNVANIRFLPVVSHFTRNLISYEVAETSVKTVGIKNFEGMIWLEELHLHYNKIETIEKDAFRGLARLKFIDLNGNKIKLMKGSLFDNLPALYEVRLYGNACINNMFKSEDELRSLVKTVNETCGFDKTETDTVCEKILIQTNVLWANTRRYSDYVCEMKTYTAIKDIGLTISDPFHATITEIDFSDNRNIEFLPDSPHQNFPNLVNYLASKCAIKEVSKRNFEKLKNLWRIDLQGNQIYAVLKDTFEGLAKLKMLFLTRNKIKFMNGQALQTLGLVAVNLEGNECIDTQYSRDEDGRILEATAFEFLLEISTKCGFTESPVGENQISCLKEDFTEEFLASERRTANCSFDDSSVISSRDFRVSDRRHDDVVSMSFNQNSKIEFLPIQVFLKFSNVQTYSADRCSIREISRRNFEHLLKLQEIDLAFNKIETIRRDTFEGLVGLKNISLSNNPIVSMNGRLFEGLKLLNFVNLTRSGCISEVFDGEERIRGLSNAVTERCGFAEVGSADFVKLFNNCSSIPHADGLIVGGNQTKPGQWPFLAALLYKSSLEFFCGGNLITDRHVLSAAHCVQKKYEEWKLNSSDILVLLGNHSLKSLSDPNAKLLEVEKVFVHESWNASAVNYDADLAVLCLAKKVEFSHFIQPICVTGDSEILQLEDGYVVGWGKGDSNANHEEIAKQALILAVNDSFCFQNDPSLGEIYSHRTFCAKGQGQGPCSGDSGGGFYVKYGGLWTLRGIVSAGPTDIFGQCEIDRFTLYTKVTYFAGWIKNTISRKKYLNVTEFY